MADRENVINELNECIEHIHKNEFDKIPFWGNCQMAMTDAIDLLKEQPQWIPISVEKPKCKGDYIVTRWVSVECTKKMLSDIAYFNGTDTWYDDCYTVYDPDRIVAWMSLPEPYRTDT